MIVASAPGKCILLGEHAVVYGYPAIAIAINIRSYCSIENGVEDYINFQIPDHEINLKIKSLKNFDIEFPKKFIQFYEMLRKFSSIHKLSYEKLTIQVKSNLWIGSGLGSSASTSIAFLYAMNEKYKLGLSIDKINEYAVYMEKFVHKNPSGIDNNICSVGGAILFQNGVRKKLSIPVFPILLTYSGESHDTGHIINLLMKRGENLVVEFNKIGKLVEEGIIALLDKDFEELGDLFNKNQEILSKLGLSTVKIDNIVSMSKNHGAYGSKITGAGLGGSVITLGEISNLQKIQNLLQQKGYMSKICYLDNNGGKIDST